ncbi:MAG: class I SAM-dependent methyltransferase [Opitutaceae bacterium]|nr:class I SAM-dependent methyltransferase [Verrucomicrobiales bacterium]
MSKFLPLDETLYQYVIAHRSLADDALLDELRTETEGLGDISKMLISREQGSFLTLLTKLLNVGRAVEVGTFTGYSASCIACGLAPAGQLTCFDSSEEWTSIARRHWKRAGLAEFIDLRLGNAAELLPRFVSDHPIDLAFIDANKTGYNEYYEILLPMMRPGGLFIFDNMLWGGDIVKTPLTDPDGIAIDVLNKKLARDPRVESVLLPIADGLHLCRKLGEKR